MDLDSVLRVPPRFLDAIAKTRTLYSSGAPLYTKAALQSLYEQIKNYDGLQRSFLMRGIDNVVYELPLKRRGSQLPTGEPTTEYIVYDLYLPICNYLLTL
jgi:hypothetical protein